MTTPSTLILAAHSMRRLRVMLAVLAAVLGGFQFLLTQVAAYLFTSGGFSLMPSLVPDFMQQMAGPSLVGVMSFQGLVAFGYFHPIVLASHLGLAIAIASEPAAEIESRFADLTLSRPLARHQAITRTIVVLIACEALLLAAMWTSTMTGLACCTPADAPRPSPAAIRSLALLLGAIAACWGGIALAAASIARRRSTVSGGVAVAALATFLLDYLGRIWDRAQPLSRLSPFHYFEPATIVVGSPLDGGEVAVLAGIAVAGVVFAYYAFAHRDL